MNLVYVDLIQSPKPLLRLGRPQRWRWIARNGDNQKILARSSERYSNEKDCLAAIEELFGTDCNAYLRRVERGNEALRLASWFREP